MAESTALAPGIKGIVDDWSSDQRAFKKVPWGKAMMWIFLLSDTFIFSIFLVSYMTVRMSTTVPWPNSSEVFALTMFGAHIPLILIAIMTFVLITSSGTMAMAVKFGREAQGADLPAAGDYPRSWAPRRGMQAFEWTNSSSTRRVPGQSHGGSQFGAAFFMITDFTAPTSPSGLFLIITAVKVALGDSARRRRLS